MTAVVEATWHVARDGKQIGVFPESILRAHYASGRLMHNDDVWSAASGHWLKLSDVFGDGPTPPPPPQRIPSATATQVPSAIFPASRGIDERPTVGIVIVAIFASLSLFLGVLQTWSLTNLKPGDPQVEFFEMFPMLFLSSMIMSTVGIIGNAAFLVGAVMAWQLEPTGKKIVRTTADILLAVTIIGVAANIYLLTSSPKWQIAPLEIRGGIIGGQIGGSIAAIIFLILVIYLFRTRAKPKIRQ